MNINDACAELDKIYAEMGDWPDTAQEKEKLKVAIDNVRFALDEPAQRRASVEEIEQWFSMIGKPIVKRSRKAFKSGEKVGIATGMCINEHTLNLAFQMDDGSRVECRQCLLAEPVNGKM